MGVSSRAAPVFYQALYLHVYMYMYFVCVVYLALYFHDHVLVHVNTDVVHHGE